MKTHFLIMKHDPQGHLITVGGIVGATLIATVVVMIGTGNAGATLLSISPGQDSGGAGLPATNSITRRPLQERGFRPLQTGSTLSGVDSEFTPVPEPGGLSDLRTDPLMTPAHNDDPDYECKLLHSVTSSHVAPDFFGPPP